MNDLISVIVPVYNVEKFLNRCVESIVKQTYKNIEIILIDDGSNDGSGIICDNLARDSKVIKVIHKKNCGVSAARNDGINHAKGEFISFVDADDWLEENFLQEMYTEMIKNNVDYITCGYNRVYENYKEGINDDNTKKIVEAEEYINNLLNVQKGYGFAHMKLIRRKAIGDIRFNTNICVGEDALFNIELCRRINRFLIYNKALYNYYFNQNSVVRKYDENYCNKYLDSMKLMNSYILKNYSENKKVVQNLNNYIVYHVLLICVNYCFHPDNNKSGIGLVKKICNIDLFKVAIAESNYNDLSLTRKISLFAVKHRMYIMIACICKFRQKQFRK